MAIGDQSNNPIYDYVTPEGTITNPFFSGRIQIIGTPNLDAVRSVNAAYRAGIRADRALCNAAGGLVGGGGSQCYFGEAAYDKAQEILVGNAPEGIKNKAQEWLEANTDAEGVYVDPGEAGTGSEDDDDALGAQTDAEGNIIVDADGNLVFRNIIPGLILGDFDTDILGDLSGGDSSAATDSNDSTVITSTNDTTITNGGEDTTVTNGGDTTTTGGGEIVNNTGEPVTTGGSEVVGTGETPVGSEYRWKYIGDGCFVQIDESGNEIPGTKVCDPDYVEEDYEYYEVGGIFGRGDDPPFGEPTGGDGGNGGDDDDDDLNEGDACQLEDGSTGVIKNGVCQAVSDVTTSTTDTQDTTDAPPQQGQFCDLPNGERGVINDRGECVPIEAPVEGSVCFLEGGGTGVIVEGVCVPANVTRGGTNGGTDGGTTDGPPDIGGPKPGDACEMPDGTPGTIGEDGQCTKGSGGGICVTSDGEKGRTDPTTGECIGTGDGPGNGGDGENGDDDGDIPLAAAPSRGMFSYNPADPYGLTYEKQTVPGAELSPAVDYAAELLTPTQELDGLLARLTKNRLFEGLI